MRDELIRAFAQGSVGVFVEGLIQDELRVWRQAGRRGQLGVTPEVISLSRRVLARTVKRLAAEQGF